MKKPGAAADVTTQQVDTTSHGCYENPAHLGISTVVARKFGAVIPLENLDSDH